MNITDQFREVSISILTKLVFHTPICIGRQLVRLSLYLAKGRSEKQKQVIHDRIINEGNV